MASAREASASELRHTAVLVTGGALTGVLTLLYMLLAGRLLGPGRYADFAAAMAVFSFVSVAVSPLTPTIARLVTGYRLRGEPARAEALEHALRRRVLRWSALAALPAALALFPAARWLRFDSVLPLALALIAAAAFTLVSVRRGALQGAERYAASSWNMALEAAIRLALAGSLLAWMPTPAIALAAYVAAVVFADLLLLRRSSADPALVNWTEVRELALPIFVAVAGIGIYQYSDVLTVKRWWPDVTAGEYGAASNLARAIGVLFVPIYTLAGPLLTSLHEKGASLRGATLRLSAYFVLLAAAPVLLFVFWGSPLMVLLYGADFRDAGPLVAKLAALPVLTYLGLIVAQAHITLRDRLFPPLYLGFAALQVVALILTRASIDAMMTSMYVVQGLLLIALTGRLWMRKC